MIGIKINLRRAYRWIIAFVFICAVIFLIRRIIVTRGYESAAGIYITTGGQSYLEIKPGRFGSLHVKDGLFYSFYWYLPNFNPAMAGEGPVSQNASFKNGRLILTQSVSKKRVYGHEYYKDRLKLILDPSKTIPGDWDLIDAKLAVFSGREIKITSRFFWRELGKCEGFSESLEYIKYVIIGNENMYCYLDPSKAPVRSFLHCIDDVRIPLLYDSLFQGDYTTDTLNMALNLSGKYRSDPYLDLLLVDMESLSNHADHSLRLYKEWMERYGENSDPLLYLARGIVWRNVSNAQWIKRSGRLGSHYNDIFDLKKTLEERCSDIRDFFHAGDFPYYPLAQPLVPAFDKQNYTPLDMPNFLTLYIHDKIFRVLSMFHLFHGRFGDSLDILASSFSMGQSLYSNGILISRILGIRVCSITSEGFECFVLNACESPEDLQRFWIEMEQLNNSPFRKIPNDLREGEYPILLCLMICSGEFIPNIEEMSLQFHISDMKFQLVRMAVAAKYNLFTNGDFPKSEMDFAPFLSEGLPEDSFSAGKPLRFVKPSDDEFSVYSIGPDEKDDLAAFAYDPTNGTVSDGDVYIGIPREREYPFPREGVRAANAYELLEQFPNGLPVDPFADTKLRPLSIIESTEDRPLIIFSFGPDTDEADFTPYIASSLKENEGEFEPVPTPEPPSNASYGRSLQWVMRRSDKIPPPPGCWTLEPFYDPTNGSVTNGDLFIEIPR
jgi:hypothetical protein